jgi:LPXTG-motif cell wall-anchored protein
MLEGDPSSAKVYDTYTITPDAKGNWSLTVTALPKATRNPDGTKGANYLYYVKEVRSGGYALESSENNSGINSGVIKLVNREQEGYLLPETGGGGTHLYTTAGLLLTLASTAYLVYISTKQRREDYFSS